MAFQGETAVKAVRKQYVCDGCGKHIDIGQPAMRWAGMTDGDFSTAIYHPECREAEIAYNNEVLGYAWGDDWWPLSEIDRDDWPWLTETHPIAAARVFAALNQPGAK